MLLSPKTRLGTYEILGLLGAGGMGEVYRAKDHRLGREVAVKVLPKAVGSSPDRLARFEREARTVAGLNHPNIVTLFSIEDAGEIRFLTMELVEGQRLADLIPSDGLPSHGFSSSPLLLQTPWSLPTSAGSSIAISNPGT
jgi:eukaryotic-like serine/threonine-protein kinase